MTLSEVSDGVITVPEGPAIMEEAVATTTTYPRSASSTNDPVSSSSSSSTAAAAAAATQATAADADIHKAIKFWTHPSLSTIPAMEKIDYLKSKGFSDEDIHRVWEKLIDDDDDDHDDENIINNSNPETGVAVTQSPQQHRTTAARHRNGDGRYRGTAGAAAHPTSTSTPFPPQSMQPQGEMVDHETSQTVALLTVGGMLGLTAAAAVRWLNGGDFALFPPATVITSNLTDLEKTLQLRARFSGRDADDADDDDDIQSHSSNNSDEDVLHEPQSATSARNDNFHVLTQQIQELTDLVKAQSESHERLLKSINMQQTTQMTDQSMDLLKRSQPLLEVKDFLLQLPSDNELVQKALEILNKHLEGEMDHQQQQQYQPQYQNTSIPSITMHTNLQLTTPPPQETPSPMTLLRQAIQRLALETDNIADLQSGCQVLSLYVIHLSSHPHVPRYRKIFKSNYSFQKVEKLPGAVDLLLAVGFVQSDGYLEWKPENEPEALKSLQMASAALTILKSANSLNEVQSVCSAALATLPASRSPTPDAVQNDDALSTMTPLPTVHSTPTTTTIMTMTGDHLISPPNTKKHRDVHSSHSAPFVFPDTPTLKESSRQLDESPVATSENDVNDANGTKTSLMTEQTPPNNNAAAFQPILQNISSQRQEHD